MSDWAQIVNPSHSAFQSAKITDSVTMSGFIIFVLNNFIGKSLMYKNCIYLTYKSKCFNICKHYEMIFIIELINISIMGIFVCVWLLITLQIYNTPPHPCNFLSFISQVLTSVATNFLRFLPSQGFKYSYFLFPGLKFLLSWVRRSNTLKAENYWRWLAKDPWKNEDS